MSRVCTICSHEQTTEIDKALIDGIAYRTIADRFGIKKTSLIRHKQDHLPQTLAESDPESAIGPQADHDAVRTHAIERQERDRAHSLDLRAEIDRYRKRAQKLSDAIESWLEDPDDPSRYDIGARSEEITVIYQDLGDCTPSGTPKRKRATLAELLAMVERLSGRFVPQQVQSKHADPRKLHLDALAEQRQQVQLLFTIAEKLHNAEEEQRFRTAILTAIAEVDPDVRQRIIDHLQRRGPLGTLPR